MGKAKVWLALFALGLAAGPALAMGGEGPSKLFPNPRQAALEEAVCKGRTAAVAAVVEAGADPNSTESDAVDEEGNSRGVTPLIWAIYCHRRASVEALLAAGADPNRPASYGQTAVTVAAEGPDNAILPLLLQHGGDPNAQSNRETALELALVRGAEQQGRGETPDRAWANWRALLAAGADIDRPNGLHHPLMFYATAHDRYDKAVELIERGDRSDPVELGRSLTMYLDFLDRMPARSVAAQKPWVDKVKAYLDQQGVHLPVPPLGGLGKDANGRYIRP